MNGSAQTVSTRRDDEVHAGLALGGRLHGLVESGFAVLLTVALGAEREETASGLIVGKLCSCNLCQDGIVHGLLLGGVSIKGGGQQEGE